MSDFNKILHKQWDTELQANHKFSVKSVNNGTVTKALISRSLLHYRVNPYPGSHKQNETRNITQR